MQYRAGRYVTALNAAPARKRIFQEKVLAESLFSERKSSYPGSVAQVFRDSRLNSTQENLLQSAFENVIKYPGEKTMYRVPCTKYDRHGYTARERLLVVTSGALYLMEANKESSKLKLKHRYSLKELHKIIVSPNNDTFVLLQTPRDNKEKDKVRIQQGYL